jgi:hypothetical protein
MEQEIKHKPLQRDKTHWMTVDDDFSMKILTLPTAVCLMSAGSCLLGEAIKRS